MIFDLLMTGIEASIALAGFSGIIATFQMQNAESIRRSQVASLTVVVQYSLLSALGCATPLLLHIFEVDESLLWAVASIVAAAFTAIGGYCIYRNLGEIRGSSISFLLIPLECIGGFIFIINVFNSLNIVFHREPGPVFAAIIYALTVAAFNFSRLLLIPLWQLVKAREKA